MFGLKVAVAQGLEWIIHIKQAGGWISRSSSPQEPEQHKEALNEYMCECACTVKRFEWSIRLEKSYIESINCFIQCVCIGLVRMVTTDNQLIVLVQTFSLKQSELVVRTFALIVGFSGSYFKKACLPLSGCFVCLSLKTRSAFIQGPPLPFTLSSPQHPQYNSRGSVHLSSACTQTHTHWCVFLPSSHPDFLAICRIVQSCSYGVFCFHRTRKLQIRNIPPHLQWEVSS